MSSLNVPQSVCEVKEEWRPIRGFDDLYFVSNHGRVYSVQSSRILKTPSDSEGYAQVDLRGRGSVKTRVHVLVLDAFVGRRSPGQQVRHLNGVKEDNRLENLAYGTQFQNTEDARMLGEMCRGSRNWNSKLKENDIPIVRDMRRRGAQHRQIAEVFGVDESTIWRVLNGVSWRHVR